jgi:hypothetical protein
MDKCFGREAVVMRQSCASRRPHWAVSCGHSSTRCSVFRRGHPAGVRSSKLPPTRGKFRIPVAVPLRTPAGAGVSPFRAPPAADLDAGRSPAGSGLRLPPAIVLPLPPLAGPLPVSASGEHASDPALAVHRHGLFLLSPRLHVVGPPNRGRSQPRQRLGEVGSPCPSARLRPGGTQQRRDLSEPHEVVLLRSHVKDIDTTQVAERG